MCMRVWVGRCMLLSVILCVSCCVSSVVMGGYRCMVFFSVVDRKGRVFVLLVVGMWLVMIVLILVCVWVWVLGWVVSN